MKISVIGSGNIGATLGKKWAGKGHAVTFGVRDVNAPKYRPLLDTAAGETTLAATAEAARTGEVVLFAIPGTAMTETVAALGSALDGKIIIDATNKVGHPALNSLDVIAAKAPNAKRFRAFNSLGWENFETPQIGGSQVDLFYCGDPGEAQETVAELIADIGLRPVYIGDLTHVETIDALTKLWFALVFEQGYDRRLAFKLLTA